MTITQQGITALLKAAITQTPQPLPEGFDLAAAFAPLKKHHMSTLLYDGAVRCGIPREEPIMQKLFQRYCRSLLVSEGQMKEFSRICAAFEENGIDYMPLKGTNMKPRYPSPELRMMGDADILIRLDQYDRIIPVMEELGFWAKHESDHELVWISGGLYVELHKRLIPSYNKDLHPYFGNGWKFAKGREGHRHFMLPDDEMIYLFTHFAKHYRDGGIGCRHVLDLWVYRRSQGKLNEPYIRAELKKLRLLEFYDNILSLLNVWFEDAPATEKTDFMTDFVFGSGSWGDKESKMASQGVRDTRRTGSTVEGRLRYIFAIAFPPLHFLRMKYTILKTHPWMLPLVWLYRPFYKFFRERDSLKKHSRAMGLLTPKNIETRHEALNYVGLDYNF